MYNKLNIVGIEAVFMSIIPEDNAKGRLFYAFLELIKKKPYQKIKVSELIEKAQVNRSTFYRYYSDIFDYYDRICNSGLDYVTDGTDNFNDSDSLEEKLDGFYAVITGRISELREVIKILTGKNGSITFLKNFRGYLIEKLEESFKTDGEYEENLVQFYAERIYIYLLCTALSDSIVPFLEYNGFEYDPKKGLVANIIECMSRGNGDSFSRLMTAAANVFLTKEPRSLNVNNITKNANVCRTEFYNYFGNMQKLVDYSLGAARIVCTQEIFALAVCDESEFYNLLTGSDLTDIVHSDKAVELARRHREYYIFIKNFYEDFLKKVKNSVRSDSDELTDKQLRETEFFCAYLVINSVAYGDGLPAQDFKKRIMNVRKRLEENGVYLK